MAIRPWNPRRLVEHEGLAPQWEGRDTAGPPNVGHRLSANITALRTLQRLQETGKAATPLEQDRLARWTSWGALKGVFDESKAEYADARQELRERLSPAEYRDARRTVLNAHYTDPRLVDAIWTAMQDLGFDGGPVLEPGAGAGVFIGLAPENAQMVGVELDGVTAAIAAQLYPDATVRHESFADTHLPAGAFAAAVGNVPFGEVVLHDRMHNPARLSIHNHFIVKSLDLVRPGGMAAFLTSRYTMDAVNPLARREIYDRADLVTAIRLPTGAHREVAGTEAVTDLLVLRVRPDGEERGDPSWLTAIPTLLPDEDGGQAEIPLNAWWDLHPSLTLGQPSIGHGMHGAATLNITSALRPRDLAAKFVATLDAEVRRARAGGLTFTEDPDSGVRAERVRAAGERTPIAVAGDAARFEGFLTWNADQSRFTALVDGVQSDVEVPRAHVRPLRALLALRDTQLALLEGEGATAGSTPELDDLRARLNTQYDDYVAAYGPINTVKVIESSRLDRNGDPVVSRRKPPVMRIFDTDPFAAAVRALEKYDEESGTAAKADIFTQRVVNRAEPRTSADNPADALAIVLDTVGEVRVDDVASLLDTTAEDARRQLGDLVFDDPVTGRLQTRAEYLSGNVRKALAAAQEAALEDPAYQVNVTALREVIPADLAPSEIKAQLGAVWIPAADVQDFLREITKTRVRVDHVGGSHWNIVSGDSSSVAATSTWGTQRMPVYAVAERLLRQQPIVVNDLIRDIDNRERRVVNPTETAAAQEKAEQLQERFGEWVWEEPDRARRLGRIYNDRFNAIALRDYSTEGERLTLPGLAADFNPHPHQRAAVARMIAEPSVGLYHGVGAGKTSEMVMGTMELRRLGLVDKPCVIVPNHMLDQFSREWLQRYPRARILAAASEDLRGEHRARFIGRAATGDWDAIVLTHKAFELLPVAKATEVAYIERELDELRAAKERAEGADMTRQTVRQIERAVLAKEEKLKQRLDRPRDRGLTFEQTGIDYLVVDELHLFKNLGVASNIQDMNRAGSQRATDLDMKVSWLREHAGDRGRVITGATATPIANSVSEAWVMQRYLRPDLLTEAGITDFDSWAGTFGTLVTDLELTPEGGYRQKSRFARFDNLPELLRMWHVSADVKTSDQLNLVIPEIAARAADGRREPETVVVPKSPEMADFMSRLAERAERLRAAGGQPEKGADNMLVVSTDGRKAALDLRMLNRSQVEPASTEPSKVDYAAARIHRIWQEHRNDTYPLDARATESEEHPSRGSLQIVFCDLGTPSAKTEEPWSFYEELRNQLAGHGMDPSRIRFMQDANSTEKKARLFAACNSGQVDVLIGSTETMGVGTNIQTRAVALHHIDCPWRPADVEQREGRILRQGNQNDQVQILRYVTEGSFDAFSWQTVERKQRFISQMMNGSLEARGAEDLTSGQALSFSEVKALASGNPLIMERAQAEQDLTRLERLARAHDRNQHHRRGVIDSAGRDEDRLTSLIPAIEARIAERTATTSDAFRAVITGRSTSERPAAADLLRAVVEPRLTELRGRAPGQAIPLGEATIGSTSFDLTLVSTLGQEQLRATLPDIGLSVAIEVKDLQEGHGAVLRLENRVNGLDTLLATAEHDLQTARSERSEAQDGLGAPFPRADELEAARGRLRAIEAQLLPKQTDANAPPTPAEAETPAVTSTSNAREEFRAALEEIRATNAARRDSAESPAFPPDQGDEQRHARRDPQRGTRAPRH